jgi:hypothetical protein
MKFSSATCHFISLNRISFSPSCFQTPPAYVPPLMSETKFPSHTKLETKLYSLTLQTVFCCWDKIQPVTIDYACPRIAKMLAKRNSSAIKSSHPWSICKIWTLINPLSSLEEQLLLPLLASEHNRVCLSGRWQNVSNCLQGAPIIESQHRAEFPIELCSRIFVRLLLKHRLQQVAAKEILY